MRRRRRLDICTVMIDPAAADIHAVIPTTANDAYDEFAPIHDDVPLSELLPLIIFICIFAIELYQQCELSSTLRKSPD